MACHGLAIKISRYEIITIITVRVVNSYAAVSEAV
jgi:hypothetical protein